MTRLAVAAVYVMNADGSDRRRLTSDDRLDLSPGWLPDGRVVFLSCPKSEDEPPDCSLVAIKPDGRDRDELAQVGFASHLDVSHDGRRIVYAQFEGQSHFQHFELHVANLDGNNHRQLTDDDTGDGAPACSTARRSRSSPTAPRARTASPTSAWASPTSST